MSSQGRRNEKINKKQTIKERHAPNNLKILT
jgi:hypothetical protein